MLTIIEKNCVKDKQAKLELPTDSCHLIISEDEILYLKTEGKIYIDKYLNSYNSTNDYRYSSHLFEYNKEYFEFTASILGGYNLNQFKVFKGSEKALVISNSILIKINKELESLILTRNEIEEFFNKDNFDSMYVLDKTGMVLFAKDKTNGVIIDKNIVPSDEEIIEKEYKDRKLKSLKDDNINKKAIEEIENHKIYKPFSGLFSHILLTVKDNKVNIRWFNLTFIKKNTFKLTIIEIPIKEITVEDAINYYRKDDLCKIKNYENKIKLLEEEMNNKQKTLKNI